MSDVAAEMRSLALARPLVRADGASVGFFRRYDSLRSLGLTVNL